MRHSIAMTVNGRRTVLDVEPHRTLLEVLRDRLDLLGTREGCGVGECGACTVLLNGRAVVSCLVLAVSADGAEITTIEGLAKEGRLDPIRTGAIQCGFCTPGMIMAAKGASVLEGNLCRCTGYAKIHEAIAQSASPPAGRETTSA
ncbi:MAG: (2Fe-2S)-binding protein [Planctomycetes bacterium]|nr:(2Fe-2S)-binding protein [Planctomycetota bacterium]